MSARNYLLSQADGPTVLIWLPHPWGGDGGIEIPFPDMSRFKADPVGYVAHRRYGVPREQYEAWANFALSEKTCQGRRRDGKPCRAAACDFPGNPRDYRANDSEYCRHHKPYLA